jgi:hypothetical protein
MILYDTMHVECSKCSRADRNSLLRSKCSRAGVHLLYSKCTRAGIYSAVQYGIVLCRAVLCRAVLCCVVLYRCCLLHSKRQSAAQQTLWLERLQGSCDWSHIPDCRGVVREQSAVFREQPRAVALRVPRDKYCTSTPRAEDPSNIVPHSTSFAQSTRTIVPCSSLGLALAQLELKSLSRTC